MSLSILKTMECTINPKTGEILELVIDALDSIKAEDIVTKDVSALTSLFDSLVIATTQSSRQSKAGARVIRDEIKKIGGQIYGVEGEAAGDWVLIDLGTIVVHIMEEKTRQYYDLDSLWESKASTSVSV